MKVKCSCGMEFKKESEWRLHFHIGRPYLLRNRMEESKKELIEYEEAHKIIKRRVENDIY